MSFEVKYTNKVAYPKGTGLNVRSLPGTTSATLFVKQSGQPAGRTTGAFINQPDGIWYQLSLYKEDDPGGKLYGYVRSDVTVLKEPVSSAVAEANAKPMIDELVKNDQAIMNLSLVNLELLQKAKNAGKDVTALENLQSQVIKRYNNRQQLLQTSDLLKVQRGYQRTMSDLVKKWGEVRTYDRIIDGVGAFPVVAVAVVFVLGITTAALVYYAFKPSYDQSKIDLNIAKDINDKIKKVLTPEEYKSFEDKLKKQVAEANASGQAQGHLSGWMDILKPAALVVAGFIFLPRLLDTATSYSRKGAYKRAA